MAQTSQRNSAQNITSEIPSLTHRDSSYTDALPRSPYSASDSKDYFGGSPKGPRESSYGEQYALLPVQDSNGPQPRTPRSRKSTSYQTYVPGRPGLLKRMTNPSRMIPLVALFVHSFLLAFSWTFFAVTLNRPVPLNPILAVQIRNRFQSVIMVVTLFSSFISLIATVLYTKAIRWSIARFLAGRISLYTLSAAMRMANESIIKNFKRPLWTIFAVLCILAINSQTASYTTLLAPKTIYLGTTMEGFELDLRSSAFQQLLATGGLNGNSDVFLRAVSISEASGYTAVSTRFGLPTVLNFNHFTYFNTTAGIMPVALHEAPSGIVSVSGSTVPVLVNVTDFPNTPDEFPLHFKMTQQGFTVNVSCQARTLTPTTSPSFQLRSSADVFFGSPITLAQLEVGCPGAANTTLTEPVLTSSAIDSVLAVSCTNNTGPVQSWDVVITGVGRYERMGTSVCNVIPETNLLDVEYSDSSSLFNSTIPNFINGSRTWNRQDAPWLGQFATSIFTSGLRVQQSPTHNSMGDAVLSFLVTVPDRPNLLQDIIGHYIRGVMETGITTLRTAFTENNNTMFPGGNSEIPPNMRARINGTLWAETVGWHQSSQTAGGVLLAPTWISVTCLIIVVATMAYRRGQEEPESNNFFDPGDLLQVVAAASAGGINVKFPPFHESTADYSEDITIGLGPVNGPNTQPGFISYEEES